MTERVNYGAVFSDIMEDFKKYYSFYALKENIIKSMESEYSDTFSKISDEQTFLTILTKCFAQLKDAHIVFYGSKDPNCTHGYETYSSDRTKGNSRPNYNNAVTRRYFRNVDNTNPYYNNVGFAAYGDAIIGAPSENLAYLAIYSWNLQYKNSVDELLKFYAQIILHKKIDKLVIDVRANDGGAAELALPLISSLVPKGGSITMMKYQYRVDEKYPPKFEPIHDVNISASPNHFNIEEGKIVCLIGNCCVSSNEGFISGIRALGKAVNSIFKKRVWLVGDTTFGSSGSPKKHIHNKEPYNTGIQYMIPSWLSYTADGQLIQDNGIKPDIHIGAEHTITGNHDLALETAFKLLK